MPVLPLVPFDDRSARLEPPLALGLLDDRHADAILDRAAGIEELRLRVDRRAHAARHAVQPDERRPSDRVEHVVVRLSRCAASSEPSRIDHDASVTMSPAAAALRDAEIHGNRSIGMPRRHFAGTNAVRRAHAAESSAVSAGSRRVDSARRAIAIDERERDVPCTFVRTARRIPERSSVFSSAASRRTRSGSRRDAASVRPFDSDPRQPMNAAR